MAQITENELWDSYFYSGTDVLINKPDCKDKKLLKEQEATISLEKLAHLQINPLNMGFGKEQLMAIHKYIFDDIYPFAGEYRKVNITKQRGTFLMIKDVSDFDEFLDNLFKSINMELASCSSTYHFSDILSKLYTNLIYCHPFREGNGRSIREFMREFSIAKSKEIGLEELELDWTKINKEMLNQYIEIAHIYPGATTALFNAALTPVSRSK